MIKIRYAIQLYMMMGVLDLLSAQHLFSYKTYQDRRNQNIKTNRLQRNFGPSRIFGTIARDFVLLHKNLFDWDTLKIAAVITPLVFMVRGIDEDIQCYFYDRNKHKNINQMPYWTRQLARFINGPIIGALAIKGLTSRDDEWRMTSQVMLLGVPILVYMNEIIKQMKVEMCLRPWHEDFSCHQRSLGGFPSGHVAKATYLAVLFGSRFGPSYGVPFGLIATGIGLTFLSSNRHYASQLIAGVGFGAVYGLAASKLVDYKLTHDCDVALTFSDNGNPALKVSWVF